MNLLQKQRPSSIKERLNRFIDPATIEKYFNKIPHTRAYLDLEIQRLEGITHRIKDKTFRRVLTDIGDM